MVKINAITKSQSFITIMRWAIAAVIPVLYTVSKLRPLPYDWTATAIFLCVTLVLTVCSLKHIQLRPFQWGLIHIIDLLTISFVILGGEGIRSECFNLYYLVILQAGLVFGVKHALGSVVLSNILYTTIVMLAPHSGQDMSLLVTRLIFSWLIGITASYLCYLEKKHHREAITDCVTSTFNRSFLDKTLKYEFDQAFNRKTNLSLLMIDIDNFKAVNDMYGHKAGDMVLEKVAKVVQSNIREVDFLARYGGEEFIVTLPGTGPDKALEVAERIRNAVETASYKAFNDTPIPVTISCGVASYPIQADNLDELMRRADECLYEAKKNGRNMVYHKVG